MAEFNDRDVEFHSLPLSESVELPDISKLILVYKKGHSHDFGALCYLHRSSQRRRRNSGRRVDFESFDKDRSSEIQALVKLASESFSFSGLRPYTLFSHHKSFIHFMDWCDSNQHSKVFSNHTNARTAFREYVDYLRRLVSQNQLNNNSAVHYQEHVLAILQDFLNVENLSQGISLLMQSNHHVEATTIPDNASQEKVLAWCKCILYGFSELCIDQKPFPYPLDVPSYLNWPNDKLWVFPVKRWCESPGQKPDKSYVAYDYQAGKIRTAEEIDQLYGRPAFPSRTVNKIVEAQRLITASNQDFLSFSRIERGMLAVKAFLMMFIASTGKNPSQAVETPWSVELENSVMSPIVERQGFRTIKYRANNRLVHFEIGIEYMPHLRRYLQLRRYLLQDKECDLLFFGYGSNLNWKEIGPVSLPATVSDSIYRTLSRLTPTLPKVIPKQWRAAKQDYLIRNHDPAMAALIMQHSEATSLKKYSNGSEITQQFELSAYFNQVEKVVLSRDEEIAGSEERSIGVCASPKHPNSLADHLTETLDCNGPESCLFCDKFRIHANETDVRKLLSARYCLRKISVTANSPEQFTRLFAVMLKRIDFILAEVKRHVPNIVERIEHDVDIEGDLDAYWYSKMELLAELQIV